jgi:capsular exopolysaccharide synthesis family protein
LELLAYWKIIRKRLVWIVLLVVAAELGAIYYVQQQVPLYRTTTTLIITPSSLGSLLPYQINLALGPLANTYIEFMRTRSFAEQVAARLPVAISASEVLNAISAEFLRDTQIFRITATHPNPEVAQLLANTTAQMLIDANTERQRSQQQARLDAQRSPEAQVRQQRMNEMVQVLKDELSYYDDQIALLEKEIADLQAGPGSAETAERVLVLRDQLLQTRTERVDVLSSLADTENTLSTLVAEPAAEVDTAVVVDPALVPTAPVGHDLLRPLLMAIFGALFLGASLAWLLEYLDYTVKSPEELDDLYALPTQGAIGFASGAGDGEARRHTLVALNDPRAPVAEAFRALRTSVRMSGVEGPLRSLLITSAGPGEGKTFVATNLAIAFAQEGKRVFLVDLDLRKPQVHVAFGVRREPGFSNLVVDRELTLEGCLQRTQVPNLAVMAAGTIPPHPAELLGSARAAELIAQLNEHADLVIYDTAPAATVTDAVVVAHLVDGVIQVVGAGAARRDLVLRCKTLLNRAGARLIGPVLNRVHVDNLGYYANYYYYGGYYHEEGRRTRRGWFGRRSRSGRRAPHTAAGQRTQMPAGPLARQPQGIGDDGRHSGEPPA